MFYPIIGIETHVQLNTKTKLFCSCLNEFVPDNPNKNICPFCTGQPGALPVLNKVATQKAIIFGVAVGSKIPEKTRWDRKNYFYPDSPSGYQISQYDNPITEGGIINFYSENKQNGKFEKHSVNLTRAHLEADAGKLLHLHGKTLVDFNRTGCPLIEIVSEPEMRNAEEATGYVAELQLLVRRLGISDADMDKGQMRFDCNLSLQTEEEFANNKLPGYKVEVKNINSIRALGRAIEYEIKRQTELLNNGEQPVQETRGWRDELNRSDSQRSKEEAMDYRYFPEPDLQILEILPSDIPAFSTLPELPATQRERYLELGLNIQNANTFVTQSEVGIFFEQALSQLLDAKLYKTLANIVSTHLLALTEKTGKKINQLISVPNLVQLAELFDARKINNKGLSVVLEELIAHPDQKTSEIVTTKNLLQIDDDAALEAIVDSVTGANEIQAGQYKSGKVEVIGFLIGQCMKQSGGSGNPQKFREILVRKLS